MVVVFFCFFYEFSIDGTGGDRDGDGLNALSLSLVVL